MFDNGKPVVVRPEPGNSFVGMMGEVEIEIKDKENLKTLKTISGLAINNYLVGTIKNEDKS